MAALIPLLREIRDPVVRDGYMQTLARRTGVEERVLLEALRAPVPAAGATAEAGGRRARQRSLHRRRGHLGPGHDRHARPSCGPLTLEEARLLRLLLLVPDQQERVADALRAQKRSSPAPRPGSCWRRCWPTASAIARPAAPGRFERCRFLESLDPELHGLAIALYAERGPDPNELARATACASASTSACSPWRPTGSKTRSVSTPAS